ncbi:MAG: bifunctional phosphoribosylaminoimidazolecarboxamide formyltransferase/IMP cyclohydrolase [Candidatus Omnitrophota bacterium]
MPKIRRALLSVYNKEGIVPFARGLLRHGAKILSTGKTAALLKRHRIPVQDVSEVTGYPELLDGRVKTLHPKIHAAILADRGKRSHQKSLKEYRIEPIDLVAVDLYPFEAGVREKGIRFSEAIELIDIGGVALLRAAAKNSKYVTAVPGREFYPTVLKALKRSSGIREETNRRLAYEAFRKTCQYDRAIRDFFRRQGPGEEIFPETFELVLQKAGELRYGENPHQEAALYGGPELELTFKQLSLHGKTLSFNNLVDLDASHRIVTEFEEPCVAIVKHVGPCGVSLGRTAEEAFQKAWACDPESAFGGVVGINKTLNKALAKRILESSFLEVIGFPKIEPDALRLLKQRKNLRLVPFDALYPRKGGLQKELRQIGGGVFLFQTEDRVLPRQYRLRVVTGRKPFQEEKDSLLFAFRVAKHVRSNAIVIVKDRSTVGIGGGQPSRVGSVRVALEKAGEKAKGAVLASDGFFPFPDNVALAARAGIRSVIQPGGSIRDGEVIAACNRYGIAMVFTGTRHFKH